MSHCLGQRSWYSLAAERVALELEPLQNMGKSVTCRECSKVYRELDELEDLRDNDSVCLTCNNTIEVADWDRILASFEDDEGDAEEGDDDDWEKEDAEEKDAA
ncbi:MAG: hypothetical protein WCR59_05575, partial [Planctomycetota bacterium]